MSTTNNSDGSNCSPQKRQYSRTSNSNARTYRCNICRNEFRSGQSLGGHMNVHRNDQRTSHKGDSSCISSLQSGGSNASTSDSSSVTYKGVRYRSEQDKWIAEIRPPKSSKTWWLGTYSNPVEAAYAYDVAITFFGSQTSLNFDGHPVYDQIPRISPNLPKRDYAMQLRKVVKEYVKLGMQSGPRLKVGEEDQPSSSSYGVHDLYMTSDNPAYEYPQQEEYVMTDFKNVELDFEEIDWDATLIPTEEYRIFSADYDAPIDFDILAPVAAENYNGISYQPASDYEPATGMCNYSQMSPAMSGYESSECYNGYNHAQQQLWSPCCNQYNSY